MFETYSRPSLRAALLFGFLFSTIGLGAHASESEFEANTPDFDEMSNVEEYMYVMNLVDGLGVYNTQLARLLEDQQEEIVEIQTSIDNIQMMRRQLGPLTERMVLSLEQFIELDLPFRRDDRLDAVAGLKDLLGRVDITTAEKFRRVMDAYRKEIEYGTSREAYTDFIEIEGRGRQVDVLRLGRTVLAFQTLDGKTTGVWDKSEGAWKVLGPEYNEGVRDALRMARATKTNDLSPVPVSAPEAGAGQ